MTSSEQTDVLADWSRRHDGYDATGSLLTRTWVLAMHRLARPIAAAGVPASAVSVAGVLSGAMAVVVRRRRAAAAAVAVTALCDGLDGAVAAWRGTASATGAKLDHVCDRVTDVLFACALRRHGARALPTTAAAVAPLVLERLREQLRHGGAAPPMATAGERPVRVVVVTAGLVAAPTAAAATTAALAIVGVAQLRSARRGQ